MNKNLDLFHSAYSTIRKCIGCMECFRIANMGRPIVPQLPGIEKAVTAEDVLTVVEMLNAVGTTLYPSVQGGYQKDHRMVLRA